MQTPSLRTFPISRERAWNWSFWVAILAFEALGLVLSSHA